MRYLSRRTLALLRQSSILLGGVTLTVLWTGVYVTFRQAWETDWREQITTSANLTLLFEETTLRTVGEIDKSLYYLRRNIEARLGKVDYHRLVSRQDILSEIIVQAAIIDAQGTMRGSSAIEGPAKPIDLSDREHYLFHRDRATDELFISRPMIGRASGKWSVQLTRKFHDTNGAFGGVVVASLDPAHLTNLFTSISLGPRGTISLIGLDGVIRATGGRSAPDALKLGDDISQTDFFRRMSSEDSGTFSYRTASGESRVASFRRIRGQPLILANSFNEPDVFVDAYRTLAVMSSLAGLLSIIIVGICVRGARDQLRLVFMQARTHHSRQRALRAAEQLRLTLKNISQGIVLVRRDLTIPVINRRTIELLGLPEGWLHQPPRFDQLVGYLNDNGEFDLEPAPEGAMPLEKWMRDDAVAAHSIYERRRPDGTVLEVRTTTLPGGGFVRTLTDITHRHKAQAEVSRLAREDALTGLANRRSFQEALARRLHEGAKGTDGATAGEVVLLCLDLDHFKLINDTLGHPVGDALLRAVAQRLAANTRSDDIAARLGGDEFSVLLSCTDALEAARIVAERLVAVLSKPYDIEGHHVVIGVSIGVAIGPRDGSNADELLKAGDLALYAAKATGRGTWRLFEPSMDEEIRTKRRLEIDLRLALAADEFELHYQPFLDLATRAVIGFEALIRWRHPRRGLVSPAEFIPVAEETGLIVPIGAWALHRACRDALAWPGDLTVAVNVSSVQFKTGHLVRDVRAALAEAGLPGDRLELEITESTLMEQCNSSVLILQELCAMGVSIAMDDFGTGYSSLSYLRSFPLSKIKIDRSFVKDLTTATEVEVIIRSIISIAHTMGMVTTAEGIETREQLEVLWRLGCNVGQGFYFSRPRPLAELPELIAQWSKSEVRAA